MRVGISTSSSATARWRCSGHPTISLTMPTPRFTAAVLIQRLVAEQFAGELRIGIGINTGVVIAGTIGGAGKLEFTLIGDAVNVAARVEQYTKTTGDPILLTRHCIDALNGRSPDLIDRGSHALKGKSAAVQRFGLAPMNRDAPRE